MASTFLTKEFRSGLIFCYLSLLSCWFTLTLKCSLHFISYHLLWLSVSATTGILVSVSQYIFDWSNQKNRLEKTTTNEQLKLFQNYVQLFFGVTLYHISDAFFPCFLQVCYWWIRTYRSHGKSSFTGENGLHPMSPTASSSSTTPQCDIGCVISSLPYIDLDCEWSLQCRYHQFLKLMKSPARTIMGVFFVAVRSWYQITCVVVTLTFIFVACITHKLFGSRLIILKLRTKGRPYSTCFS
jgi:hypothetical protein